MDPADPTTPPPPRLDEFRPGTLLAVFDSGPAARAAAREVAALSDNEPYVLAPDQVEAEDRARDAAQGPATKAWKLLTSFLSDQNTLQAKYLHLARAGGYVLVAVARDETQAQAIWDRLRAGGAHDGTHFAGPTIRELV